MNKQQLKQEFQDHIKKEYPTYWDNSIIDFLREVSEEIDDDGDNTFFAVVTIELGGDTITLEGTSNRVCIFDFAVRIRSHKAGFTSAGWVTVSPCDTLKRFTLDVTPQLLDDYKEEYDKIIKKQGDKNA